jgi:DNA-binding SARP family transcriptional activator
VASVALQPRSLSSTAPGASQPVWLGAEGPSSPALPLRWGIASDRPGAGRRRPRAEPSGRTRIDLCGRLAVEIEGRALQARLPGRQGRMLFAYLAANRARPVSRDELMGALWPDRAPADPGAALSTLLTRLRQSLGTGVLTGRHELSLQLPPGTSIDLEVMEDRAARAERRLSANDARGALHAGREALALAEQRLLPEFREPWVEERRQQVDELRAALLDVCARAGLMLGGHELTAAERAARALVAHNPYRESGYALLMEINAARGDVAEALRVFDGIRLLLRDSLGVLPSRPLVRLSERLLGVDDPGSQR